MYVIQLRNGGMCVVIARTKTHILCYPRTIFELPISPLRKQLVEIYYWEFFYKVKLVLKQLKVFGVN